jgi:hypothetical protein
MFYYSDNNFGMICEQELTKCYVNGEQFISSVFTYSVSVMYVFKARPFDNMFYCTEYPDVVKLLMV